MSDVVVVEPQARWPDDFLAVSVALRGVLGPLAVRVDHVGSTSVPGLVAKDVVDVQVGVADEPALAAACAALLAAGYPARTDLRDHPVPGEPADDASWRKGFTRERPGERRANVHLRVVGRTNFRYALLFRDYLRQSPATAEAYGQFKRRAAALLPDDADTYSDLKDPVCDLVYQPARAWALTTGWAGDR